MNESEKNEKNIGTNVSTSTESGNIKEIKPLVAKSVHRHALPEIIRQLQVEGMILVGKPEDVGYGAILDAQFELIGQLVAKRDELFGKMQQAMLDNDQFYAQVLKHNLLVKRHSNGRISLEHPGGLPPS